MSVLYFTNTADAGDGSLRQCIANAVDGDIIMPSDATAWDGDIIIQLSSQLSIGNKTIELNAGTRRVILDGQGASGIFTIFAGALTVEGFNIIRGAHNYGGAVVANDTGASLSFRRCLIAGNWSSSASYGDIGTSRSDRIYTNITASNCVLLNGRTTPFSAQRVDAYNIDKCTIAGYVVAPVYNAVDTIQTSETPATECGFIASPPNEINGATWNAEQWREWDVRLKPSSQFLTGATHEPGAIDFLGHERAGEIGAYSGGWLVAKDGETLDIVDNCIVDYLEIGANAGINLDSLSGSRFVSVKKETFVGEGATMFSTYGGYLATANGNAPQGLTLENVKACYYGADLSAFEAYLKDASTVAFTIEQTGASPFLIEKRAPRANTWEPWETVDASATTETETTIGGLRSLNFRAFDGVNFLYSTVERINPNEFWQVKAEAIPTGGGQNETGTGDNWSVNAWEISPNIGDV